MKGRTGKMEAATSGVDYNKPLANNSKANIMASARMRKRGGAVAMGGDKAVEGAIPMKRMDKPSRSKGDMPKRASGGGVSGNGSSDRQALKSIRDNMEVDGKKVYSSPTKSQNLDKVAQKTAGKMLSSAEDKPARAAGGRVAGKIGADKKPISTANRTMAMRGHSTQANIT